MSNSKHKVQKREFYVKNNCVEEKNVLDECSLVINTNPANASELFDRLNRGGKEAMSRKIFRDHIKKRQVCTISSSSQAIISHPSRCHLIWSSRNFAESWEGIQILSSGELIRIKMG